MNHDAAKLNTNQTLLQERISHVFSTVSKETREDESGCHPNSHDYFEVGMIISGSGIHSVDGNHIPCKSGDIYIVPSGVEHQYSLADNSEPLVIRKLLFYLNDWFKFDTSVIGSKRYCYGVFNDGFTVAYAMLNASMRDKVYTIMDSIECELLEKEDEWHSIVRSYLIQLFIFLGRYINNSKKNTQANAKDASLVSDASEIIENEFENSELSLDTIAKRLFVSSSHLSRSFKTQKGRLFSEYLREVRLSHAAKLLKESDMNVDKIVLSCGYRDLSSFYRNFRETYEMTPQIYRQIYNFFDNENDNNINENESEKIKMSILTDISTNVQNGKAKIVKELVQQAIDNGASAAEILNDGLLAGMAVIGEKFKNNQVYVPEVLVAARAMNMGAQILKPYLAESGVTATGKVCIGTVRGDLHDIGKNLVKMMMEGKGLEVIDLGTDVAPETFINTAIEENCQIICCSALLTTTMPIMEDVVKIAEKKGIRDKVKIMIGGAPVSEEYCKKIGADCYTPDAASAADAAVNYCKK